MTLAGPPGVRVLPRLHRPHPRPEQAGRLLPRRGDPRGRPPLPVHRGHLHQEGADRGRDALLGHEVREPHAAEDHEVRIFFKKKIHCVSKVRSCGKLWRILAQAIFF